MQGWLRVGRFLHGAEHSNRCVEDSFIVWIDGLICVLTLAHKALKKTNRTHLQVPHRRGTYLLISMSYHDNYIATLMQTGDLKKKIDNVPSNGVG